MKAFLKRVLIRVHLFDFAKRIKKKFDCYWKRWDSQKKRRALQQDFKKFWIQIEKMAVEPDGILVLGILLTPHKPTLIPFLQKIQEQFPEKQITLLDENPDTSLVAPFTRLTLPRSIPQKYDNNLEVSVPSDMEQLLTEKEFLRDAVTNLKGRQKGMTVSYIKVLVCSAYRVYNRVIDVWKPRHVVIWSEYSALHTVCTKVCRERDVEPLFLEFGVLPGTFAFECGGQMGESDPAIHYQEFLSRSVDSQELQQAQRILAYLKENRLNRNIQPQNDRMEWLKRQLRPNRPIVLFAGQNDYDSGLVPYTEHGRQYHSPVFATSLDAMRFLAALANKNDWNLIFKPHPTIAKLYPRDSLPHNVIFVNRVDLNDLIDQADVIITIMSQTAYVSLIRDRATVTLGYNQLRGKGCAYEAFSLETIESEIVEAICHKRTEIQKKMFVRHVAQLLKEYLFDDLSDRELRYGKKAEDAVQILYQNDTRSV